MSQSRHELLQLTDEDVLSMYKKMLVARMVDERLWLLNRAGKIPFVVSCQGQEAAQVGAGFAMVKGVDYLAPYYRDVALVTCFGTTIRDHLLSNFAKAEDPNSGGRQMPGHFSSKELKILTASSPVTTQVPHAVGVALAAKIKNEKLAVLTTLGEGSTNQGDFHEGLNFAGVHKLPVITMIQNNGYAISVPIEKQYACENLVDRAKGYGMEGYLVDGNDPLAVYEVVKKAREKAINGEGPTLIEAKTTRLTAHSSDDDDSVYRTKEEINKMKEKEPIERFKQYLMKENVLTENQDEEIRKQIQNEIDEATEYAENASFADPESALNYVYEEEGIN